jgi:hypothetical protein
MSVDNLHDLKDYLKGKISDQLTLTAKVNTLEYKQDKNLCILHLVDAESKLTAYANYNLIQSNIISPDDVIQFTGYWNYHASTFVFEIKSIKKISSSEVKDEKITKYQRNFKNLSDRLTIEKELKNKLLTKYPILPKNLAIVYNNKENISEITQKFLEIGFNVHKYGIDGTSSDTFNASFADKVSKIKNADIVLFYLSENDILIEQYSLKTVLVSVIKLLETSNSYIIALLGQPLNYPVVHLLCHKTCPTLKTLYDFLKSNNDEQIKLLNQLESKCNAYLTEAINNSKNKIEELRKYLNRIQLKHKEALLLDKNKKVITYKNQIAEYIKYYDGSIVPIDNKISHDLLSEDSSSDNNVFTQTGKKVSINEDFIDNIDLSESDINMFKINV